MRKFFAFKTGTGDKYVHVSSAPFPVATVCPPYPYREEALARHGVTRSDLQWRAQWVSNSSDVSPLQFYEEVVMDLQDVVKKVVY